MSTVYVVAERVQYYGPDGKLITESLKDYTRKTVRKEFASLDDFLRRWNSADKKQAIIDELEEHGVLLEALRRRRVGKDFDPFDLICHIAYDQPPLTRKERAEQGQEARLLHQVRRTGPRRARAPCSTSTPTKASSNIEDIKVLTLDPFTIIGTPVEIINSPLAAKPAYLASRARTGTATLRVNQEHHA